MTINNPPINREILLTEGRLGAPSSAALVKYHDIPGLAREKRMFREFNDVDRAHTVMLAERGILPREVASAILEGLLEIRRLDPGTFPVDPLKGSLLLQVESYLFSRVGEDVAGQMHTGRSRIDQGATVRRLYKRNRLLTTLHGLNAFRAVLIDKAEAHASAIMPGYTHMQQSQPWVFGHYLLSIVSRLSDDFDRLVAAYARVNLNPLGAVGLSGTSWPLDRRRTTELLGFGGLIENSKLARESFYAAEAIGALSFVMSTLNDLATDLHIWSSTEFAFVESHDAYCGTSSIFPQKKNPVGLETVKKVAGGAVTWLATALATFRAEGTGDQAVRGLPLIDEAFDSVEGMLDLFAGIISTLIVHETHMRAALNGSWCTASNLADVIVRKTGLSFRQIHHVVARLVRICIAENITPSTVTADVLNRAAQETLGRSLSIDDAVLRTALDPEVFVKTRRTTGSVAPDEVNRMIHVARAELAAGRDWLESERTRIADATAKLDAASQAIVAG